jgi:hypothetical protein
MPFLSSEQTDLAEVVSTTLFPDPLGSDSSPASRRCCNLSPFNPQFSSVDLFCHVVCYRFFLICETHVCYSMSDLWTLQMPCSISNYETLLDLNTLIACQIHPNCESEFEQLEWVRSILTCLLPSSRMASVLTLGRDHKDRL